MNKKLIEVYGRRFTTFSRLVALIAIAIIGIIIAFSEAGESPVTEREPSIEQSGLYPSTPVFAKMVCSI